MERRTLLRNLVSSMVAVPVLGALGTKISASALVEAADEQFMQRAIRLAGNVPKYPFGALLVDQQGTVVGEGWNRSVLNPTWHGEMDAINKCAASNPKIDWTKLTLYTTAEPCAMCQGAVAWTGNQARCLWFFDPILKIVGLVGHRYSRGGALAAGQVS